MHSSLKRAGNMSNSVVNGSPRLRHFFQKLLLPASVMTEDGPCELVTRFGVIQRMYNERFDLMLSKFNPPGVSAT